MSVSDYLLAPALAWAGAQLLKYLLASKVNEGRRSVRIFLQTGSMPSVHTALVTALVIAIAGHEGLNSPVFAVALIFALIVGHDAMQVRRATGEQGTVIQELVAMAKLKLAQPTYVAKGHQPIEVAIGVAIGLVAGLAVLSF